MAVTAAQLAKLRDQLFLVQGRTELQMPSGSVDAHGDDDPLVQALDKMINDLLKQNPAGYADVGGIRHNIENELGQHIHQTLLAS